MSCDVIPHERAHKPLAVVRFFVLSSYRTWILLSAYKQQTCCALFPLEDVHVSTR